MIPPYEGDEPARPIGRLRPNDRLRSYAFATYGRKIGTSMRTEAVE